MRLKYFATISAVAASFYVAFFVVVKTTNVKAGGDASPIFGVELPAGYRDWQVISVAHEAGNNNDIRAILGNDIAVKAFRNSVRPFPDGTIVARLAYEYVVSEQNNAIFG